MPIQFEPYIPAPNELIFPDDEDRRDRIIEANRRLHCLCGRFAKPGRAPRMDYNGEYWYTVHCTRCGEVWIA